MTDTISSLPDGILCHILSFLSLKEAALTSVLAKRWRNLFAFSPNLCVDTEGEITNNIIEFVDRVLAVSGSSLIKQFKLRCGYSAADPVFVNRWLCNVLSRGVSDLQLNLFGIRKYTFPSELFSCKTLVKLELRSYFGVVVVPENASLPALKSLFLTRIQFFYHHGCCAFEALVSACPVLEKLVMVDVNSRDEDDKIWHCTVSSPTLQRLTMRCTRLFVAIYSRSITFNTPSLAYFKYLGFLPQAYSVVNFDSLVEAELCLNPLINHCNPTNLLQSLRNVEILHLPSHRTLESIYYFQEAIPVFKKLHHLSIATKSNDCWQTLLLLLKNCPNLETLVIDPLHYDENEESDSECLLEYSCLSSCPVKVLEITLDRETMLELNQLKHVVEKLACLELVKVRSYVTELEKQMQLSKDIMNLPRSSKCKIQFEFIIRPN